VSASTEPANAASLRLDEGGPVAPRLDAGQHELRAILTGVLVRTL